MIMKADD